MSDPTQLTATQERILRALRLNGPARATELRARVGLSRPGFSDAVAPLRPLLVSRGATSSLTYGLRRGIPGLPAELPVFTLGADGPREVGRLCPVYPRGHLFDGDGPLGGFHPDLPWFLDDLRPSGFLGRLEPRRHPELGFPDDVTLWSGDQALAWLATWGFDAPGAFVVGEQALRRALDAPTPDTQPGDWPALAEQVLAAGPPGSSAGGEQPKLLTRHAGAPVLVKFSPPVVDAPSRRTADLLRCEHRALRLLAEAGVPAARSAIHDAGGRVFLAVERFDRVGTTGRRGVVSLRAVAAHHGAPLESWTAAATALRQAGAIPAATWERAVWLDRFGALTGNTDRHAANLSFFLDDGALGPLAPVYDMLPMAYAVRAGEVRTPPLAPPPPLPILPGVWREVFPLALRFWREVADDASLSAELRAAARANADAVEARLPLLDRLPEPSRSADPRRRVGARGG